MDILERVQAFSALLRRRETLREELYAERDLNLRKLEYRDYSEYLHSHRHWRGRAE
jgi:hypothetical protein